MTETIIEIVNRAKEKLSVKGLETRTADLAMRAATGKSEAGYLASLRDPLPIPQAEKFHSYVDELLTGRPIQYILGEESFYGYSFEVNEHVLIPRPETEELVYHALQKADEMFGDRPICMADIGTGSGAIAVAFKKERPSAQVAAVDISGDAIETAKRNAERNEANITFLRGDMEEPLAGRKWDIILSNPPYIAEREKEEMSPTVFDFEPSSALFAEEEGLYFYRRLSKTLVPLMNKPSFIGFEIGWQQGPDVQKMLQRSFPEAKVEIVQDINGKDRMIFCEIR